MFDMTATDLPTYGVVTAALVGVTVLAAYVPAQNAARINPTETLKAE